MLLNMEKNSKLHNYFRGTEIKKRLRKKNIFFKHDFQSLKITASIYAYCCDLYFMPMEILGMYSALRLIFKVDILRIKWTKKINEFKDILGMGIRLLHMFTIIFKNLRFILNAFCILHQGEY